MREDLKKLVDTLLARSRAENGIHIDAFGDAVTPMNVGPAEIEQIIDLYESRGGVIIAPTGQGGPERLKKVLDAARALRAESGRAATPQQIAEHTGLTLDEVRGALELGRVMGR